MDLPESRTCQHRRGFLKTIGGAALAWNLEAQALAGKPDFTLRIGKVSVDLKPGHSFKTIGYNDSAPGPLIRVREGQNVRIDVYNETDSPELVHWHGLHIRSEVDGSMEEGTPLIPPRGYRSYSFAATPAGTRWYHTHTQAHRDLNRATYTGQFGFFYIEPVNDAGDYDQEVFLALKEWDPFLTTHLAGMDSLDVFYKGFSINGHALGYGEPIRVKQGQRVLLRILNASATLHRRIGLSGHAFNVIAMDGNRLPAPKEVKALELGPAERIDAVVEMNRPGVWILGAADDHDREAGLGIVIEYSGKQGAPQWIPPGDERWDYAAFGVPRAEEQPAERIPLVFQRKFVSSNWVDKWTINGKGYPKSDPIRVRANGRYRLIFDNQSDEAHPVHLHRHTFELVKVEGVATSGVRKDVVVVRPRTQTEVDLVAANPGPSLFHCHQQMHMDYGFMTLLQYD